MKIVVTGSLGNVSKPVVERLTKQGHSVVVITSKNDRKAEIAAFGAIPAVGTVESVDFLTDQFVGADAVYLMEPGNPNDLFDPDLDYITSKTAMGTHFKTAIDRSGVEKIVHLSSVGAHMVNGNGLLAVHHNVEQILRQLPDEVSITFIRAASFFPNLFYFLQTIKDQAKIFANYGTDQLEPWVSIQDIADAIVEELESSDKGRKIRYVASEELTPADLTQMLAEVIGIPQIEWVEISDEAYLQNMVGLGMTPQSAKIYTELTASRREGIVLEDYFRHRPPMGGRRIKDYIYNYFLPAYKS